MLARRYPEQDGPSPERLVASHMDLVRKIAWHMHGRVGRLAEIERELTEERVFAWLLERNPVTAA